MSYYAAFIVRADTCICFDHPVDPILVLKQFTYENDTRHIRD